MKAWTRRTPIRKNAHEPAFLNSWFNQVLRQVREPDTLKCCVPYHSQGVEHDPSLDTDLKFTSALPEFPNVEAPVGGQTKIDAIVLGQVLR